MLSWRFCFGGWGIKFSVQGVQSIVHGVWLVVLCLEFRDQASNFDV